MVSAQQLFLYEKEKLQAALAANRDTSGARDAINACVDRVKHEYIMQQDDKALRSKAVAYLSLVRHSAAWMLCASEAKAHIELKPTYEPYAKAGGLSLSRLKEYIPLMLCLLVCVIIASSSSQTPLVLLSFAAAGGSFWQMLQKRSGHQAESALPRVSCEVFIDENAAINTLEQMLMAVDHLLQSAEEEKSVSTQNPVWTQQQYAAIQMLWEALQADDSEYAMKAIPALLGSLEQQSIHIVTYSDGFSQYFDTLPGVVADQTIRPALFMDGKLVARGQVTIQME